MSREDLTAIDFVGHILQAADRILEYTKGMSRQGFYSDSLTQDAVIRNIEIIGEATNNLLEADPTITTRHPSIPFTEIYGMRNRVAHGYFAVSLAMVWDSVEEDVPDLRQRMALCSKNFKKATCSYGSARKQEEHGVGPTGVALPLHGSKWPTWNRGGAGSLGVASAVFKRQDRRADSCTTTS